MGDWRKKSHVMSSEQKLGFCEKNVCVASPDDLLNYINIKLMAMGCPPFQKKLDHQFFRITGPFFSQYQEKNRFLSDYYCPADQRIHEFLQSYFSDIPDFKGTKLPVQTFVLDRHGLARMMSLPADGDVFESPYIRSTRIAQGVVHNPRNDRRTTKGVFHIVEGGLPVPSDKKEVPKIAYVRLLQRALTPPSDDMVLPFTCNQEEKSRLFLSLLLRPLVSPKVPGWQSEKAMEIRFFAPGGFVSNLDFVESIFGNAGDPFLPHNDAGLDVEHWTGHTGCVILAPHLTRYTKKELGLPHVSEATDRQKHDGMCWAKANELYNDGEAFKITCRDKRGVMVTIIADNYFGYCKKEVKTQISYASNLLGLSEEEHAGGAIAFPSYDLGEEFDQKNVWPPSKMTFKKIMQNYGAVMDVQAEGYGVDKKFPHVIYVPEHAHFDLLRSSISWKSEDAQSKIALKPGCVYVLPSGFRVEIKKHGHNDSWRLIGTRAEGTLCHKPCTVSGGGKSEISKSIDDTMLTGPIYVADLDKDFTQIEQILAYDFSKRFRKKSQRSKTSRPVLSPDRTLGSVIKLFTPSSDYTDEYNEWLRALPAHLRPIIYVIKRLYKPEWGADWRSHFMVDQINGGVAHELKYHNRALTSYYFRVGFDEDGSWRVFNTRYDFSTAAKLQVEDDITASVVVPVELLPYLNPQWTHPSVKLVQNCEYRLFQRPDDAIYPGQDKTTEEDMSSPGCFLSNFEPMEVKEARAIIDNAIVFDAYSKPMQDFIKHVSVLPEGRYFCLSSHPRIVDGKPTKNPRYLQNRPDMVDASHLYVAKMCTRMFREIPLKEPVLFPVNAVLPGRRNNGPDVKNNVPSLAVYNPIHYQELPELFIDFMSSVTGKSPSTTGFGSEGALTKGPFNALRPAADLNSAFLSYVVTGYNGFSSAAGVIGPNVEVRHDISLLIPEIWCRMTPEEQHPQFLIDNGCLEKVKDFEHKGRMVPASLLGYRITLRFVNLFLGRIFNNPNIVFTEQMLRPEKQDMELFVEGIDNLMSTHKRVAENYIEDGTIDELCPPLQALVHIMATGHYKGKTLQDAAIRHMFKRDVVLKSGWYKQRLKTKQKTDVQLMKRHQAYLKNFSSLPYNRYLLDELSIEQRMSYVQEQLARVQSAEYLEQLKGTLGAQSF